MSYSSRPLSSHLRHQSGIGLNVGNGSTGSGGVGAGAGHVQSPALLARIQEKKVELESLQELRQLSESLARQMQVLQDKLSTLSSGTEAVEAVMTNWHMVLRAIYLASAKLASAGRSTVGNTGPLNEVPLPQTLVRIPTQPSQPSQPSEAAQSSHLPPQSTRTAEHHSGL